MEKLSRRIHDAFVCYVNGNDDSMPLNWNARVQEVVLEATGESQSLHEGQPEDWPYDLPRSLILLFGPGGVSLESTCRL